MDRHGAYVALSRHRDGVDLLYGRDDFKGPVPACPTGYEKADPARDFAEGRGITFRERIAEIVRAGAEKARGIFDNFRPKIPVR